jgi:hypothetical protein
VISSIPGCLVSPFPPNGSSSLLGYMHHGFSSSPIGPPTGSKCWLSSSLKTIGVIYFIKLFGVRVSQKYKNTKREIFCLPRLKIMANFCVENPVKHPKASK